MKAFDNYYILDEYYKPCYFLPKSENKKIPFVGFSLLQYEKGRKFYFRTGLSQNQKWYDIYKKEGEYIKLLGSIIEKDFIENFVSEDKMRNQKIEEILK
jgi:hypothetical protein